MNAIVTLDGLFDAIDNRIRGGETLASCMGLVDAYQHDDWKQYKKFSSDRYVRTQLQYNDLLEFVLICWSPGQAYPLHDHATGGCIYRSLEGMICESRTNTHKKPISRQQIMAGHATYIDNTIGFHAIANTSGHNAVTLHIYTPPHYVSQIISTS